MKLTKVVKSDTPERSNSIYNATVPDYSDIDAFASEVNNSADAKPTHHRKSNFFLGVLALFLGVLVLVALFLGYGIIGYDAGRDDFVIRTVQNIMGEVFPSGAIGERNVRTNIAPAQPLNMTGVSISTSTGNTSFMIQPDSTLWAWGANWQGTLGDGTFNPSYEPILIMDDVVYATLGTQGWSPVSNHALAIRNDGSLWACAY